jgi:DNA-binding NarL/FixJ family response regulator
MCRILIIEDNETFRQALTETLREHFPAMLIEGAGDGSEALQKIDAHPPDLIFMDISLPGQGGLMLTKRIKERYPETVIIIITNYDLPEYREAAHQYGAKYFLSKSSSSLNEIAALLESLLAGHQIE